MNIPLFFSRRYLVSQKSQNVINIISAVSALGVMVGTMALIVVLSVFNGFEELVLSLYNSFDPEIKITLREGKTFQTDAVPLDSIRKIQGVSYVVETLEENALLKYNDQQYIATLKGVGNDFIRMTRLDSVIAEGSATLERQGTPFAIAGNGIAYFLSLNPRDAFTPLNIYLPLREIGTTLNPEDAFRSSSIALSGVFSIQQDFDAKYVIVPLHYLRELLSSSHEATALELGLVPGADSDQVISRIKVLLGNRFVVKNRLQQHELLYKILRAERWAVYLILTFILIIATFSIAGSLTMLIIEKKKDIGILHSLGASSLIIRRIFMMEGLLIACVGALLGLLLGMVICRLQQVYGFVSLHAGGGSFIIDAYPVQMKLLDFVYVFVTVMAIGLAASWFPSRQLKQTGFIHR